MGNVCDCCVAETENKELAPVEAPEVSHLKVKTQEKAVPNYQSIIDVASSQFISSKPRFRTTDISSSGQLQDAVDNYRGRLQEATIEAAVLKSPLLEYQKSKSTDGETLKELSKPLRKSSVGAKAASKIAELVTTSPFPEQYYPIDAFAPPPETSER